MLGTRRSLFISARSAATPVTASGVPASWLMWLINKARIDGSLSRQELDADLRGSRSEASFDRG